jgi:hypothetical protein
MKVEVAQKVKKKGAVMTTVLSLKMLMATLMLKWEITLRIFD